MRGQSERTIFLEINGSSVAAAHNDAVYELVMTVAANQPDIAEIASALERLVESNPPAH